MTEKIINPFRRPTLTGKNMDVEELLSTTTIAHHPDPNNKNWPLCWMGQNKVETGECKSFAISWVPHFMNCQDCREWMHA